jgi:hypothetical protein
MAPMAVCAIGAVSSLERKAFPEVHQVNQEGLQQKMKNKVRKGTLRRGRKLQNRPPAPAYIIDSEKQSTRESAQSSTVSSIPLGPQPAHSTSRSSVTSASTTESSASRTPHQASGSPQKIPARGPDSAIASETSNSATSSAHKVSSSSAKKVAPQKIHASEEHTGRTPEVLEVASTTEETASRAPMVPAEASAPEQASVCGNGIIEDYEECDDGSYNGHGSCTLDCLLCDHDYYGNYNPDAELSELYRDNTLGCADSDILVLMWLDTDIYAPTESSVFMFDSASPLDDAIWAYDVGAFEGLAFYQWATCLPADACYEFYYLDSLFDGFAQGGIYFEAGGETLLNVFPGDVGSYSMYEEFWGVYFGTCEGAIKVPSERVQPHEDGGWVDPVPFFMSDTSKCTETSVEVTLNYEADVYASEDNELYLFDADTPADDFFWAYEVGSFIPGDYTWSTCVEKSRCNELYFFDAYGDGLLSGGLTLTVDGVEALSIRPGDNGTSFEGEQYWGVAFGNCHDTTSQAYTDSDWPYGGSP